MDFTVGSALNFGWETFKQRPWFFIGASVVIVIAYLVVGGVSTGINAALGGSSEEPTLIGSSVNFGLSTLVGMGAIAFYLAAHDNPDTVELSALWHPQPFLRFLGASILMGLAVGIGFVLLVVPGIIALLFFMFTTLIVIDRGLGPIEAMQESMRIGARFSMAASGPHRSARAHPDRRCSGALGWASRGHAGYDAGLRARLSGLVG